MYNKSNWGHEFKLKYTYNNEIKENPIKSYKLDKKELEIYLSKYKEVKYKEVNNG